MASLLPLRFRMLHFFSTVNEASANDLLEGLKSEYGSERQFSKKNFVEHLLTMKENGIIDETKVELDKNGDLCIYYSINDEGRSLLKKYLPKSWKA